MGGSFHTKKSATLHWKIKSHFGNSWDKIQRDYIPHFYLKAFLFLFLYRQIVYFSIICIWIEKLTNQNDGRSFLQQQSDAYGDDYCTNKSVTFHFASNCSSITSWTGSVSSCKAQWEMESPCDLRQLWKNGAVSLASSCTGLPKALSCPAPSLPRDV